jgi:F-type H+-transporting ATPase subunit delta
LIQSKITLRYIRAILDIAAAQGKTDAVEAELQNIDQLLKSNPAFMNLLLHPKISRLRKKKLLDDTFGARFSALVKSFLHLLVEKKREELIPVLFEEYKKAADRLRGIVKATVKSAIDLSDKQCQNLKAALEKRLSSTVELQFEVDRAILGGMQIFIGNDIIDGSIRGRLDKLQKYLLELSVSA